MTKWAVLSVIVACIVGIWAFVACSGGAGSSLNACPAASDITPGDTCVTGVACPSTQALPDCPGSVGSISCNCTSTGWVCVDPHANPCFPDGGDGGSDEGGDSGDEGGGDDASDSASLDETPPDQDAAPDAPEDSKSDAKG